MKRILQYAAVNILGAALISGGIPLQAASYHREDRAQPNTRAQIQTISEHGNERYYRGGYDRDRQDNRDYYDRDAYRYSDRGYEYGDTHAGRTAAIIGGSAAAGALVGAAAGHGEGAAIGAVIGGVAGAIASDATHHRDWR